MAASDDRPTKTCPDCAETVLAAARKCRFCGYRFDGLPPEPAPREAGGLMGLLRRSSSEQPATVPGLLDQWGVELGDDERADEVFFGDVDRTAGFVVVTDERFLFVETVRRSATGPPPIEEHALRDLLGVEIVRKPLRRRLLVIDWRRSRTVIGLAPGQLARVHALLAPHVPRT